MPKVVFVNEKKEIEVEPGANLRTEAQKAGLAVHATMLTFLNPVVNVLNCRGNGLCGTCRVLVKKGMEHLSPKTTIEKINLAAHPESMLASIGHEEDMRLACQVQVNGDCTIETQPGFNWSGENFWQKPYPNK
jgi:ferredoxin